MKTRISTNHLLSIEDLSRDDIYKIFKLALKLKKNVKKGRYSDILKKKSLAMIFEKSSTRTRVSFETGITQLGGHALFLSGDDIQLGRGESIADTAKVLSRYVQGIMIRTFSHEKVAEFAHYSTVPVINGLSDSYHPCQALADYFTMYEREQDLSTVKIAYVGDGNNVSNSLMIGAAKLGMSISVASPKKYSPEKNIIEKSQKLAAESGASVEITEDIISAAHGSSYMYTDVWVSMGQEKEKAKKRKTLLKYKITRKLLENCAPGCKVMHCLPAYRGEEIDADVIDSDYSIVFDQAENRMHVQKAVMCLLMG